MASSPGGTSPSLGLRRGLPADAEACGRICYDAFRAIAERHGFPPDFPSPADAVAIVGRLLAHPGFHAIVAESDGRVVGSNFLDERSTIAGLGPITVDPGVQNAGVGRRLMLAAIERVRERHAPGVRLLQSAYHNRSLSLYTTLGFNVREPVVTLQGAAIGAEVPGYRVRQASEHDVEAGNRVCVAVHGHDRSGELRDAIREGSARVVEHGGRITGYTTGIAFFAHSVGKSNEDMKALIAAAPEFAGPGFLLPARNAELYRWCLARGLRVVQVMTLMTLGLYNEPAGAYLPTFHPLLAGAPAPGTTPRRQALLMDEPFAALDVQTRFQMQSFLLDIWRGSGKTVVFVTHHIDEAVYLADRVVVLTARPGRVLDSVAIDMPRPRSVIGVEFERHRAHFIDRLRAEVAKAFQEQELVEMLDTRIK